MALAAPGPDVRRPYHIRVPSNDSMPELPTGNPWADDSDNDEEDTSAEFKAPDPIRSHFRKEALARNKGFDEATARSATSYGKYKTLPEYFKFTEAERVYTIVSPLLHEEYRGDDMKRFDWFNDNPDKRFFAMVSLAEWEDDQYSDPSCWGANQGCQIKEGERVMITPNLDTQWPSLSIFVKRDNGKNVECRVYGSECDNFRCNGPKEGISTWWFEPGSHQEVQGQNNELLQFTLTLKPSAKLAWGGITKTEIDAMDEEWLAAHPTDRMLVELQGSSAIQACITLKEEVDYTPFAMYFEALMETASAHGNLWFWKLQHPTQQMSARNFLLEGADAAPPRWMVKEWLAIPSEDGTYVEQVVPVKWATFREPGVWPDEETTNAIYRLDLARSRPLNDVALREGLDKQSGDIVSSWTPYKQAVDETKKQGYYLVNIWCSFATSSVNNKALCPEKDTPVVIQILTGNGRFHRGKYHGFVVPDVMRKGCSFSAFVYGDTGVPERCNQDGSGVRISVEIDINSVAIDRQMGALIQMNRTIKDREPDSLQIDFGRFFMGFPPTPGCGGRWATTMSSDQRQDVLNINLARGSNQRQMDFVREVCDNRDGIVYLNGPPGTGKSRTLANFAHSFVDTNRFYREQESHLLLVTAPTNDAVEALLKKMVEDDPDCESRVVVHFQGASSKTGAGHESAEDWIPEGMPRDAESALWEMLDFWSSKDFEDGSLKKYSFQVVFKSFYDMVAQDTDHAVHAQAQAYAKAVEKLKYSDKQIGQHMRGLEGAAAVTFGKLQRVRYRESKDENEEALLLYFWRHHVDILCCTMSSAGHPKLRATCRATGLLLDEAGYAITPDLLTPVVANMDDLEVAVLAGDHKQQKPMVQNQGQNEFAMVHPASLLEEVAIRDGDEGKLPLMKRIVLQEQYRMTPDLMNLLNRLVYNDQLIAAPSVSVDKPQAILVKQVFSGLGPCFKQDWSYMGVSISGEDVYSETFANTTSLVNFSEAEAILQTAKKLVAHQGHEMSDVAGDRIKPRNILVITPYSGQASLLWTMFKDEGLITSDKAESARINSFAQVQGDEELIVLVSLCSNNPERQLAVQFPAEEHGLTVGISRAMVHMMLFANWKVWEEAKINKVKGFFPNKRLKMLHKLMEILCEQEDPADCRIVSTDNYNTFLYEGLKPVLATFRSSLVRLDPGEASTSGKKRRRDPADATGAIEADSRRKASQNKKAKGEGKTFLRGSFNIAAEELERTITKESAKLEEELQALTVMSHADVLNFSKRWPSDLMHHRLVDALKALVSKRFFELRHEKPLEKQPDAPTQPRVNSTVIPEGRFLSKKDDRDLPFGPGLGKGKQRAAQLPESGPGGQTPAAGPLSYKGALEKSTVTIGGNQVVAQTFRQTEGSTKVVLAPGQKTGQPGPHTQLRAEGDLGIQIRGNATAAAAAAKSDPPRNDLITCSNCNQVGHLAGSCPSRRTTQGPSDARNQPEAEDRCDECDQMGHLARFCPNRPNNRGRGGRGRGNGRGGGGGFSGPVVCFNCRETGHIARACPNNASGRGGRGRGGRGRGHGRGG